jgi:hypothetical protein
MRYLRRVGGEVASPLAWGGANLDSAISYALGPGAMAVVGSRKELLEKYDQSLAISENNFHLAARDANWQADQALVNECKASARLRFKYVLLTMLTPAEQGVSASGERYLGRRDGVMTAIGLELYRRQHGAYPQKIDDLTPLFIPSIPADRITGDPIKYRIKDDKPLLYSVGADRIDDGGKPATRLGAPHTDEAAQWWLQPGQTVPHGDWILYPQPASPDRD